MTPDAAPTARPEWTREDWVAFADRLIAGARRHASVNGARIDFPGDEGGYGRAVDGLEGFARTFLIAGFRIAGANGEGVDDLLAFLRGGIAAGVDPTAPDRWVRIEEHAQAKVEAASLALVLDMTRPWLWDTLDETTRTRVIDYLAAVVGDDTYPRNNWLWFRIVVQTFLRSVDGPWSAADIEADLALHDSFVRADGWLSDGDERAYDHYVGWALHLYPVLWVRMRGAAELASDRPHGDRARLDRFLQDAVELVGADGSPLIQGRSLIYRFAAAAPFWAGAIAGVPSVSPGRLRVAAERIVRHFVDAGALEDDVLTMGWHGPWRRLAQSYSGPGSPYWAAKGLIGIMLPADHPVWTAPAEPLPVEEGDTLRAVAAPGWIVAGTTPDGIVRVINHGTDRAVAGSAVADSPLYARLGYSTATSPLLDEEAWTNPLEQSVALIDPAGRPTHRAAMDLLHTSVIDGVGVCVSTADAHVIAPFADQQRHGSGWRGNVEHVARITIASLVRGAAEVRVIRVDSLADGLEPDAMRLRVGGWAVSDGIAVTREDDRGATATVHELTSAIRVVGSEGSVVSSSIVVRNDASPLGETSAVPIVHLPVRPGHWQPVTVTLSAAGASADIAATVDADTVRVSWPDGHRSALDLFGIATAAMR